MRVWGDGGDTGWVAYTTSLPWTFSAAEGAKSISVQFVEDVGNYSARYQDSTTLTYPAPAGPYADCPTAGDLPDPCVYPEHLAAPISTSFTWQTLLCTWTWLRWLDGTTGWGYLCTWTDTTRATATAQVTATATATAQATATATPGGPPPIGDVFVAGESLINGVRTIYGTAQTLDLPARGQGGLSVTRMYILGDGIDTLDWIPYTPTYPWVVPLPAGPKTVLVQYKDEAGNASPVYTWPGYLDPMDPQEHAVRSALSQDGWTHLASDDETLATKLGVTSGPRADIVASKSGGANWLIAESKGSDVDYGVKQLQATADALFAYDTTQDGLARATVSNIEARLYVDGTTYTRLIEQPGYLGGYENWNDYLAYRDENNQLILTKISNVIPVAIMQAP